MARPKTEAADYKSITWRLPNDVLQDLREAASEETRPAHLMAPRNECDTQAAQARPPAPGRSPLGAPMPDDLTALLERMITLQESANARLDRADQRLDHLTAQLERQDRTMAGMSMTLARLEATLDRHVTVLDRLEQTLARLIPQGGNGRDA